MNLKAKEVKNNIDLCHEISFKNFLYEPHNKLVKLRFG